ncbi:MAG: 50S ribosomal protein L32 [Marinilabiliales bacterium]|nr:50S ribosomal protein L32 [Marinilabiliales bacterium]
MAHPKRKHSKTRREQAQDFIIRAAAPTLGKCSNCSSAVLYHRVCPECGFYRGKLASREAGQRLVLTISFNHEDRS